VDAPRRVNSLNQLIAVNATVVVIPRHRTWLVGALAAVTLVTPALPAVAIAGEPALQVVLDPLPQVVAHRAVTVTGRVLGVDRPPTVTLGDRTVPVGPDGYFRQPLLLGALGLTQYVAVATDALVGTVVPSNVVSTRWLVPLKGVSATVQGGIGERRITIDAVCSPTAMARGCIAPITVTTRSQGRLVVVARRTWHLDADRRGSVAVPLTPDGRRLLAQSSPLMLTVSVTSTDPSGLRVRAYHSIGLLLRR
jgi:hypothetical protein